METKIISYLTFKIGTEIFATNVKNIQNIIENTKLTKVPKMPSYIIGVTNLRGEVLPVVDSRIKLGLPVTQSTFNSSIIVLELIIDGIETKAGLLVDEVCEVLEINDEDLNEPPKIGSEIKAEIITGVYPYGDKFVMLLDINKVLMSADILAA